MIRAIPFEASAALAKEISLHPEDTPETDVLHAITALHPSPERFLVNMREADFYADLCHVFGGPGSGTVLDVGTGPGLTSAYLALMGYAVTAVDPALSACRATQTLAGHLGVTIDSVHGIGEALDALDASFDTVLFHSSLHHCDDPDLALRNAYARLRPGGRIWLLCENILSRLRSKQWFYRTLEANPESVGHYGGNEHVYRVGEYLDMLRRAGFAQCRAGISPMALRPPRLNGGEGALTRLGATAMHRALKTADAMGLMGLAQRALDALSLGPRIFTAIRPDNTP